MHDNEQETLNDDWFRYVKKGIDLPVLQKIQEGDDHEVLSYVHLSPVWQ
jgi:hypothetical protein